VAFVDESHKLFLGRFLTFDEFPQWLAVQNLGSKPAYEVSFHHTYIPDQHSWNGRSTLDGVFRYYRDNLGWPSGVGPHLWVAPKYKGGPVGIWVATHPRHDGIAVAGSNHRRIHIETVWNGDARAFGPDQLKALQIIAHALKDKLGIPLRYTGATKGQGWFAHRDRASKSCPGRANSTAKIMEAIRAPLAPVISAQEIGGIFNMLSVEEQGLALWVLKLQRIDQIAGSYDRRILMLKIDGAPAAAVEEQFEAKARDVAKEKKVLGLG